MTSSFFDLMNNNFKEIQHIIDPEITMDITLDDTEYNTKMTSDLQEKINVVTPLKVNSTKTTIIPLLFYSSTDIGINAFEMLKTFLDSENTWFLFSGGPQSGKTELLLEGYYYNIKCNNNVYISCLQFSSITDYFERVLGYNMNQISNLMNTYQFVFFIDNIDLAPQTFFDDCLIWAEKHRFILSFSDEILPNYIFYSYLHCFHSVKHYMLYLPKLNDIQIKFPPISFNVEQNLLARNALYKITKKKRGGLHQYTLTKKYERRFYILFIEKIIKHKYNEDLNDKMKDEIEDCIDWVIKERYSRDIELKLYHKLKENTIFRELFYYFSNSGSIMSSSDSSSSSSLLCSESLDDL